MFMLCDMSRLRFRSLKFGTANEMESDSTFTEMLAQSLEVDSEKELVSK